jgi:hypothetical protein
VRSAIPPSPRQLLAVLGLSALAACGEAPGTSPTLRLGTGESSFAEAADGDTLPLVAGSQGGHHIWLSLRMAGFDPGSTRMALDVIPSAPAPPAHSEVTLHFDRRPDDADDGLPYEFDGWPARVLAPECAVGEPVLLDVTLHDARGHSASAQLSVVAGAPRLPFASACSR